MQAIRRRIRETPTVGTSGEDVAARDRVKKKNSNATPDIGEVLASNPTGGKIFLIPEIKRFFVPLTRRSIRRRHSALPPVTAGPVGLVTERRNSSAAGGGGTGRVTGKRRRVMDSENTRRVRRRIEDNSPTMEVAEVVPAPRRIFIY